MLTNNEIQYKAYRFRMEVDKTTFAYGIKGVRAMWDPSLSIPGTNRRGGWRCPIGTRFGGQITDRFGRNCGWGIARRIANAITNIGERLENVDDRRRGRRVSKRNRRMLGRLQRNAEAGRAERGLRGIADVLDGGEGRAETLTGGRGDGSMGLPGGGGVGVASDIDERRRLTDERRRLEEEARAADEELVRISDDLAPDREEVRLDDDLAPDGSVIRIEDDLEGRRRRRSRRSDSVPDTDIPETDVPETDIPETETPPRRRRVINPRKPPGQLGRGWRGVLNPDGPLGRRYWERDDRGWFDGSDGFIDVPEGGELPDGGTPETPDAEGTAPTRPGAGRRRRRPEGGDEVALDDDLGGRRRPRRKETLEDVLYGPDYKPPKRDGREPGEIVFVDGKPYKWEPNLGAGAIGKGPQKKGYWVPASETDLENDRLYQKRLRNREGKKPKGAPDPEGKRRIWTDDEGDQWEYTPQNDKWTLQGNIQKRREAEAKDKKQREKDNERRLARAEERRRRERGEPDAEAAAAPGAPPDDGPPFDSDARDAGLRESERRRVRREIEEPGAPRNEEGAEPREAKPRKPRKRRVEGSEQRAQESATRKPGAEAVPAGTQKKPTERIDLAEDMVELELAPGESMPDERSFRNVDNRFPAGGLPDTAYWRKKDFPEGEVKAELERRFGRYYGADNNINNRGKFVNRELERRRFKGKDKSPKDINLDEDMVELELAPGESKPDERSFRNVNNRFPKNGLPKSAYWRDDKYDGNDKFELERRFGRYYDGSNNINNRGKVVNQELKRRRDAGFVKPSRKPKTPKTQRKPEAEKPKVDLPSQPPLPPFMPGTQLDDEVRKVRKALEDVKRIAEDIDREPKDFPNLPKRPWWRDTQGNGLDDEDRAKIEAALGQFYDRNGKLNPRGGQIFNAILAQDKEKEKPKTPKANTANADNFSSVEELIEALGMGWRQLDEGERNLIRQEYEGQKGARARIKELDEKRIAEITDIQKAEQFMFDERRSIIAHQATLANMMKQLRDQRTTRGGELSKRRQNEILGAIARIQQDIGRRRELVARALKKRDEGFLEEAPEAPDMRVPSPTEAVNVLGGSADQVPLEKIIPQDGSLAGETRDAYRARIKTLAKNKEKMYLGFADNDIAQMTPEELRKRRNQIADASLRWRQGYDAAQKILELKLKEYEGKKLDALSQREQQELKDRMDSVNVHAAEMNALDKMVKQYDAHLDKVAPQQTETFDGSGLIVPNEPSPIRRPGSIRIRNYEDAVKAVHEGNQGVSIEDVADEVIVDALFDESLAYVGNKNMIFDEKDVPSKEDLQTKGFSAFMAEGGEMENRRFNFELIKVHPGGSGNGVWDVVKVRDKRTGQTWFVKAAVYGHHGAMLESIGMRAAEAIQLGNDRAHLRIGKEIVDADTGKRHRWMMMRGIMDWDHGAGVKPQQEWADVKKLPRDPKVGAEDIAPEDAARISVLDFVFKNGDRHGGNFMYTVDQNGKARLGLIDHGLIAYGRGIEGEVDADDVNPPSLDRWEDEVANHRARLQRDGVRGYHDEWNNGIEGLKRLGFNHQSQEARERFARTVDRTIRVLEKQLEQIMSQQELEQAGMKLTQAEINHLNAIRRIVADRLDYLKRHKEDLIRQFN